MVRARCADRPLNEVSLPVVSASVVSGSPSGLCRGPWAQAARLLVVVAQSRNRVCVLP